MTSLFLDLSGRHVRALLVDGSRCLSVRTFDSENEHTGSLGSLLRQVTALSPRRIRQAHLVIPDCEVSVSSFKLQAMPLADAEKIISRRLGTVAGKSQPRLLLTTLDDGQPQQTYLAESCDAETISRYRDSFAEARIRLRTVTTPLQALLAALAPLRLAMTQPHIVFHIDNGAVTTLFLTANDVLYHSRTAIPSDLEDPLVAADPDRRLKRKLFGILTHLHGIYSQCLLVNPRFRPEKVWMCGAEAGIDGLPAALADAMNLDVSLANLLPVAEEHGQAYAVLTGLLREHRDPKRGNLLADRDSRPRLQPRISKLAAMALFMTIAAVLVVFTENRIARLKNDLQSAGTRLKALDAAAPGAEALARQLAFLNQLDGSQVPFYEIFRELAEQLPDEVMLDGIRYLKGPDRGTLELTFITANTSATTRTAVFSAITDVLDSSPHLANHADPVISIIREDDSRLIQVTVSCTVPPAGGAQR